ncbi:hypothetical protein BH23BAC1_BH23BAC1_18740 [soil metagenome]
MKLPIGIAKKLLLLVQGEKIPSSELRNNLVNEMLEDGIVQSVTLGKSKKIYFIQYPERLNSFLSNLGIDDLSSYIESLENPGLTRAESIAASSFSKLKNIRTFKGFLINSYNHLEGRLNDEALDLYCKPGTFLHIYDWERFIIPPDITVVGIENPENFRNIELQKRLFNDINPLFVTRFPYSHDLVNWLKNIPNPYLHYGDFDFMGINIYQNEYKRKLGKKASFFIPDEIEKYLQKGSKALYNKQFHLQPKFDKLEEEKEQILGLIGHMHAYKKMLEQEYLINYKNL